MKRSLATHRDDLGRKRCYRCEKWKPETDFPKNSTKTDGLSSECRLCNRAACKEWATRKRGADPREKWDHGLRDEHGRKRCRKCKEWQPEDAFARASPSEKYVKDDLKAYCRRCTYASVSASYRKTDRRKLLARYGLTPADYAALLARQGGSCAICGSIETRRAGDKYLAVDHCHKTGEVRGLLCHACNMTLGKMHDSPDLLRFAADYLEGWMR